MAKVKNIYSHISLVQTGCHIKYLMQVGGYTVRDVQEYLHLSCPQPIYRWFKGQMLPSVDHLYMLSKLLGVHMEELLVEEPEQRQRKAICSTRDNSMLKRLLAYWRRLCP